MKSYFLSMEVMILLREMKSDYSIIPLASMVMWQERKMKLEDLIMALI